MDIDPVAGSPAPESEGEGEDLRPGAGGEDSSEEGSDDSAEERAIREGFIVDDDEEGGRRKRHKKRRKHKDGEGKKMHKLHEELGDLDEDDLDLIGMPTSSAQPGAGARKLRRLREGSFAGSDDLDNMANMFADEDAGGADLGDEDDLDDFIADEDDEDDAAARAERRERARQKGAKGKKKFKGLAGIDREAWEEISDIFGTGDEYAWAMELDPTEEEVAKEPQLTDIYEPAEIAARHLTQADEIIRRVDLPERFQVLQRAYLPSITYDEHNPLIDPEHIDAAARYIAPRISPELHNRYYAPPALGAHLNAVESEEELQARQEQAQAEQEAAREDFIHAVSQVLSQMHHNNVCEVPFIQLHRPDLLHSPDTSNSGARRDVLVDRSGLWRILHLSFEFRGLLERQRNLARRFDKVNARDEYWSDFLWPRCSDSLEGTTDLAEWLALIYGERSRKLREHEERPSEATAALKVANRKTKYTRAKSDSDVLNFIDEVALSPSKLIKAFFSLEEAPPVTDPVHQTEFAASVAGSDNQNGFGDGSTMLAAAKHVLAQEIAHDPILKASFRDVFGQQATVSVQPTEQGKTAIDDRHPYAPFKWLKEKPLASFEGTPLFLKLAAAEQEGLIEINFRAESQSAHHPDRQVALHERFAEGLSNIFFSAGQSEIAEDWNQWRLAILNEATQSLMDHASAWLRSKLVKDAQEVVLSAVSRKFEQRMECIPYTRDPDRRDSSRGETPSVVAISAGAGEFRKDDIHAVFLDVKGRMRQSTTFETLAPVRDTRPQHEQDRSNTARDAFREFLKQTNPTVIVVGGWTIRTKDLLLDVRALAEEVGIPVIMVEDSTARLYRSSADASKEFQELHEVGRYCVGLARYVQCPAAEYAALSTSQLEGINFDANQKYIPVERLRFQLEQSLVNVINYTGIDINQAVRSPYIQKQLPYISGLGPRKANMLIDKLTSAGGTLLNRADMFSKNMLTERVFWNCTAFIRIDQNYVLKASLEEIDDEDRPDILDSTRIHNEDYEIARKMASDAEDLDEEDINALEHPSDIVRQLLEKNEASKLDDLRLDDFAAELSRIMQTEKRMTLYFIREELQHPWFDARPPLPTLSPQQQFQQISGESPETLSTGMVVPAVVFRFNKDNSLLVKLDSGVDGKIEPGYIVDSANPGGSDEAQEVAGLNLKVGDTLRAAVLKGLDIPQPDIMNREFAIEMDCRPAQLNKILEDEATEAGSHRRLYPLDPDYDRAEAAAEKQESEAKEKKGRRQRRLIAHNCFQNLNAGQAEQFLASQQRGDCVIRPSSKGEDHLTCTWKVAEGIYQHFDILEMGKPQGNALALGTKLRVVLAGGTSSDYNDLDELIYSHVRQLGLRIDEMFGHEKFKGTEQDCLTFCRNFQMANPGKPVYAFALDEDRAQAGNFKLMFIVSRGQKEKVWPIKVNPRSYILHGAEIGSVNDLCNAFKLQYQLRQQQGRGAGGGQSTYVPGRTPRYGGASVHGGRTPMAGGGGRTPSTAYGYR